MTTLEPIFKASLSAMSQVIPAPSTPSSTPDDPSNNTDVYLHVKYYPSNPPLANNQRYYNPFQKDIQKGPLHLLNNFFNELIVDRTVVAYHCYMNIENCLSIRKLK